MARKKPDTENAKNQILILIKEIAQKANGVNGLPPEVAEELLDSINALVAKTVLLERFIINEALGKARHPYREYWEAPPYDAGMYEAFSQAMEIVKKGGRS